MQPYSPPLQSRNKDPLLFLSIVLLNICVSLAVFLFFPDSLLFLVFAVVGIGILFLQKTDFPKAPLILSLTFIFSTHAIYRGLTITDAVLLVILALEINTILRLLDKLIFDPVLGCMLMFLTMGWIGVLLAPYDNNEWLLDTVRWLVILLFYIYGKSLPNDLTLHTAKAVIAGVVIGAVATSLVAIYELITRQLIDPFTLTAIRGGVGMRPAGLFGVGTANAMAAFVAAAIPWAFWGTQLFPSTRIRILCWLAFGIMVLGIFATGSRSGAIVAALTMLLYVAIAPNKFRMVRTLSVVSACLLGILFFSNIGSSFVQIVDRRFDSLLQGNDRNTSLRADFIRVGLAAWEEQPIFGNGIGIFPLVAATHPESSTLIRHQALTGRGISSHNSYINALTETGIMGLFFFVIALVVSISRAVKLIRYREKNPLISQLGIVLLVSSLSICVSAFTAHYLVTRIFWFMLGWIAVLAASIDSPTNKTESANS